MGSGYKTWNTGDVLTAPDLNGYLMQQAIVTCTSSTRPASPSTGQPIYETDTKVIRVYDGATWYCPASPEYTAYTPTFYSNASTGTTISAGSVSISYCNYQKVNHRVHYYGHAVINVTVTSAGLGVSLPFATPIRVFTLSSVHLQGASGNTTYANSVGNAHIPTTSAPYNRFVPVDRANSFLGITSGDTVHWNINYECV